MAQSLLDFEIDLDNAPVFNPSGNTGLDPSKHKLHLQNQQQNQSFGNDSFDIDLENAPELTHIPNKSPNQIRDYGMKVVDWTKDLAGTLYDDTEVLRKTNHQGLSSYGGLNKLKQMKHRTTIGLTDTLNERHLAFDNIFGKDGWRDTVFGEVITPAGLIRAGYETSEGGAKNRGFMKFDELGAGVGDIFDVSGHAPEIVTAVGVGMGTAGYGFIPAMISVGISSGAMKFAQEEIEALLGNAEGLIPENLQSTFADKGFESETFKEGVSASKRGALGEGVGRLLIGTGRYIFQGRNIGMESAMKNAGVKMPTLAEFTKNPLKAFMKLKDVAKVLLTGKRGELKSTIDPEKLKIAEDAEEIGVVIPPQQSTGGKNPILERIGNIGEHVHADIRVKRQQANVGALTTKGDELVEKAGQPPEGVKRLKIDPEKSTDEVNTILRDKAESEVSGLTESAQQAEAKAGEAIEQKIDDLGDTALDVQGTKVLEGIKDEANKIHTKAGGLYARIDQLLGKTRAGEVRREVPTKQIRDAITKYLDETFQVKTVIVNGRKVKEYVGLPANVKETLFASLKADKMQSFQSIHASRTRFRKLAFDPDFLKTVDDRFFTIMEQAHTKALASAKIGNNPKAMQALVEADAYYAEQLPRLDNKFIRSLLKDARHGGVEPSQVIGKIENANLESIQKLFGKPSSKEVGLLTTEQQTAVREGVLKIWFDKAGGMAGEKINSKLLMRSIDKLERNGTFKAIFGKKGAGIKELVKQLEAKNAKIDIRGVKLDKLKQNDIKRMLVDANDKAIARDAYMETHFIKELQKDGAKMDDAIAYLMQKGKSGRIKEARDVLGKDSAEWSAVKEASMRSLLDDMISHTENIGHIAYKGEHLLKKLVGAPGQPGIKNEFIEMFGKEMYAETLKFAKVATASMRENARSPGLIASTLAFNWHHHIFRIMQLKYFAQFLNKPSGMRWLTKGFRWSTGTEGAKKWVRDFGSVVARTTGQVTTEKAEKIGKAVYKGTGAMWSGTKKVVKAGAGMLGKAIDKRLK